MRNMRKAGFLIQCWQNTPLGIYSVWDNNSYHKSYNIAFNRRHLVSPIELSAYFINLYWEQSQIFIKFLTIIYEELFLPWGHWFAEIKNGEYRALQTQLLVWGGFESALSSPSESVKVIENGDFIGFDSFQAGRRYDNQKWRLVNSLPEPVFRYFSNAQAFSLLSKAIAVWIRHGLNFEVCGTSPALCLARRACKSSVTPV